ncbi:PAS domain S-box protein [Leptolyngbya sp. FACHB-261]|nr:PAS domain S-box protein [Leptolyngbya sp. FACHB-261]
MALSSITEKLRQSVITLPPAPLKPTCKQRWVNAKNDALRDALTPNALKSGKPASSRTSEQIRAEIQAKFGFVPPFFGPAEETPEVLENLWQQTLAAYVNNPLPALFKEKLSTYLSRYCAVPYCMVCHSCTLRPLGLQAREVLALLQAPSPSVDDVNQHLQHLATHASLLTHWPAAHSSLESSLLACAIFMALEREHSEFCRQELRRLLGPVQYQHLVTFIAYVKTCHVWMEAHPEVAYEADQRVQKNLPALLLEEPALANFFRDYQEQIRYERQSQAERLAELAERQRHERALRQAATENLKLAQALASVSDGVLITDPNQPDNPVIYANSAFLRTTGYEPEEILGRNCRFLQGTDTDPEVVAQIGRAIAEQREIRAVLLNYRKDGESFWSELRISPVFSEAGHCLYFVGIQTDITERKRAEQKIREQAALLDITTDAITVCDLEQHLLFWSKGAERLYGWQIEEVLGQPVDQLLHEEKTLLTQIQRTLLETGEWQGELHQVTKTGREIIVSSRWTLVRDSDGKPKSALVVSTDITEKKQLEAQFLRAQRMESLGTLAGGIAHDLNNILTPILLSVQLLKRSVTNERAQQLLTTLENNGKRGANLVKQVLSFARGADGERTFLQIKHLISEIETVARETFPRSITIKSQLAPDLWMLSGDATQLHQVLMNLCVNARDAMPNGGTLSMTAANLLLTRQDLRRHLGAQVGPYVVLTVSDTGTGMRPEVVDRIFEPFFTTKEVGKGTGLGLSTVMGIIRSHGGFVEVDSKVGRGTQFQVYLPAIEQAVAQPVEEVELPPGNGELILVVDDEAPVREITQAFLELYNYRVLLAQDGIEAVALYVQHQAEIGAVLLDMMMPVMDGTTTARTLQKLNPKVKILATSGLAANEKVTEASAMGIAAFLAKPYSTQELLRALRGVLHTSEAGI